MSEKPIKLIDLMKEIDKYELYDLLMENGCDEEEAEIISKQFPHGVTISTQITYDPNEGKAWD